MNETRLSDTELGAHCLDILTKSVGPVDAERFISYVNREKMDYTKWQQGLFAGETIDSIAERSRLAGVRHRAATGWGVASMKAQAN